MSQQNPKHNAERMEKIVSLCKRRGFVFQSSEIYGGLNGCWDYGPLGVELKRNLKDFWWRRMTRERDDVVGLDGSILMNRRVWQASGHEATFSDPMVDCLLTKKRFRAIRSSRKAGQFFISPARNHPQLLVGKVDEALFGFAEAGGQRRACPQGGPAILCAGWGGWCGDADLTLQGETTETVEKLAAISTRRMAGNSRSRVRST